MKKAEFRGVTQLGATLAVTGAFLSIPGQETYAGAPQPEWCNGTQVERADSLPTAADEFLLPPLPAEFDRHMPDTGVLALGFISVDGNAVDLLKATDVPELPRAQECALRYAVDDPFIRATMQKDVDISIFAMDSGKFPGTFMANTLSSGRWLGSVLLSLETQAADSVFFTSWGEVRMLLMHEMGHAWAHVAELQAESGDVRLQQLLDGVTAAYLAQTQAALEQIRVPLAARAAPELRRIARVLQSQGLSADAVWVEAVLAALQGTAPPGLLSEIACDENATGLNKCQHQFISNMITNLAKKQGHSMSDVAWALLNPRKNPAMLDINRQHVALLEDKTLFPMSDISSATDSQGGHPYSSANEKSVDELIIPNILGIDATVARIAALPAAQRQATIDSYIATAELYGYVFSAEAREATVISKVALRLRALLPR